MTVMCLEHKDIQFMLAANLIVIIIICFDKDL